MNTFKSVIPEITFLTGVSSVIIGMVLFMNWQVALIFGGAVLILVSNYLHEVMSVAVADE